MDEKRKALALLVRMNYILDFPHRLSVEAVQWIRYSKPRRNISFLVRSGFPIFDGEDYLNIWGRGCNTSYALSIAYDWRAALACTMRNFVHLCLTHPVWVRPLPMNFGSHPRLAQEGQRP